MKKILTILLVFFCAVSFAQPVTQRSGVSQTVQDSRLMAQYNLFVPRYADTLTANAANNRGIDSCGAIIFTYDYGLWYRACSPKRWLQILPSSSVTGDTLYWSLKGNLAGHTPVLGTTNLIDLNFETNNQKRFSLNKNGILANNVHTVGLGIDTTTGYLGYGGSGSAGIDTVFLQLPIYCIFDTILHTYTIAIYDASASSSGVVNLVAQSFAGPKTLLDTAYFPKGLGVTSGNLNLVDNQTSIGVYSGTNRSWYFGETGNANGNLSFAAGYDAQATGARGLALGNEANSGGLGSTALGSNSKAPADLSSALSAYAFSQSFYEIALGPNPPTYAGSLTTWVLTDNLFTIGGSPDPMFPAIAFKIDKAFRGTAYNTLSYNANYGANYTSRTLTDKNYVDSAIAAGGGGGGSWNLTGNSGTTAGTNFIGTTDSVDFVIKTNGVESGRLNINNHTTTFGRYTNSSGSYNVLMGENAAIGTGTFSVVIGQNAGNGNTGTGLTAVGQGAGNSNGGSQVTAIGQSAGISNTAPYAVLIGQNTGNFNTGDSATAVGALAAYSNTGKRSTFLGMRAGGNANAFRDGIFLGYNATASANKQLALSDSITAIKMSGMPTGAGYILTDVSGTGIFTAVAPSGGTSYYAPTVLSADATDADYTAVSNSIKYLPAATLTANRTITIPMGANGDILEIYNNEAGFLWNLGGASVYLSNGSTTISSLTANTNYIIRKVSGKWRILN